MKKLIPIFLIIASIPILSFAQNDAQKKINTRKAMEVLEDQGLLQQYGDRPVTVYRNTEWIVTKIDGKRYDSDTVNNMIRADDDLYYDLYRRIENEDFEKINERSRLTFEKATIEVCNRSDHVGAKLIYQQEVVTKASRKFDICYLSPTQKMNYLGFINLVTNDPVGAAFYLDEYNPTLLKDLAAFYDEVKDEARKKAREAALH